MSHISIYNTYILFTTLFKNQDKLSNKPFYQNYRTLHLQYYCKPFVLILLLKTFCKIYNQDKLQNLSIKTYFPTYNNLFKIWLDTSFTPFLIQIAPFGGQL